MGIIGSDLDEHFTEAILLLTSKHVEESLGRVLETIVLDLLELEIAVRELFWDGVVEVFRVLVLKGTEMSDCLAPSRSSGAYLEVAHNESSHHQSLGDELEQVLDAIAFTVVARDPSTGCLKDTQTKASCCQF